MTDEQVSKLQSIITARGIDIDALKAELTDDYAIERFQRFIEVGRQGWADPMLQASLERIWDLVKEGRCLYHTGHGDCLEMRSSEAHGERPRGQRGGVHRFSTVPTDNPWGEPEVWG